ncbi:TPA: NAD-dependent DNA ligase LigA, partial [Candidatus Bipolaricaulota bacterium]|nr:NAD-dependent DNA ligase LigA [Candidatus Bipolaricaulota bacterium]
ARASYEELVGIPEIGPRIAQSIVDFFASQGNRRLIEELKAVGIDPRAQRPPEKGPLAGKAFLFTGRLSGMTRQEAKRLVESLGGKVASSVSRKVDYVVVGEDPGSKLDRARALGITTLSEEEFKELVGR